jgi:serine phosphatase RsbU (regulator of sigma subunit)
VDGVLGAGAGRVWRVADSRVTPAITARVRAVADTGLEVGADPALDRIAGLVRVLLDVPVAVIALFGAQRQFFPGAAGLPEPLATRRHTALDHALCQPADLVHGPVVVTDARIDTRYASNPAIAELGVAGCLATPLIDTAGIVLGALYAIDHAPRRWSEAEMSLLADAALACSDSLQLRITTRRAEIRGTAAAAETRRAEAVSARGELLLKASVLLARTRTVAQIVAAVAQLTSPIFDPALVGMVLLDDEHRLHVFGADDLPGDVAARWVSFPTSAPLPAAVAFRTGQTLSLPDPTAIAAEFPHVADEFAALGWQAVACEPVPGVRGTLGVLTLSWEHPHHLDAEERSVVVTLAGYVGQALQRVTHLDAQNTAAHTLQQALLTPLPATIGLRLSARYLPAHYGDLVGGDWYDAIALPGDRLALVIGDVSGHNLTAASAMSELRSMLRGFLIDRAETPSAVLERLDHANRALKANTIATVVLAYLEPRPDGGYDVQWSNAGHPPPTVITADGHISLLPGTDPLLGARNRRSRSTHRYHLLPGATLLLHTDGLVETRDATIDDGITRLHRLLTDHPAPDGFADLLAAHADRRAREDDVALIVATAEPAQVGRAATATVSGGEPHDNELAADR